MSLPRGIINFSSKTHNHSEQSVLSSHNFNKQNFVEQRRQLLRKESHHKGKAWGIIGAPACLPLAVRAQGRESRSPENCI